MRDAEFSAVARAHYGNPSQWYAYMNGVAVNWLILSLGAGIALTVVLLASGLPARRAARVQPMQALKKD